MSKTPEPLAALQPRRFYRPVQGLPLAVHLCEDPEAGWQVLEPHAVHVIKEYAKWAAQEGDGSNSPFKGLEDPAMLKRAGLFVCVTPEQLVEIVGKAPAGANVGFQPLLGGLSPDEGWKSLKLLEQVMPDLRKAMQR